MQESRNEAITRVLALAVVAILLSLFAAAVASSVETRPFSESQAGASGAATPSTPSETSETEKIKDDLAVGAATCPGSPPMVISVNYACGQSGALDTKSLEQACRPGFDYIVTEKEGKVTVTPKVRQPLPASCSLTTARPACSSGVLMESVDTNPGKVTYVVGAKVGDDEEQTAEEAGACGAGVGSMNKLRTGAVGKLLLNTDPKTWNDTLSNFEKSPGSSIIDDAFRGKAIDSASTEALTRIRSTDANIRGLEDFINGCNKYAGSCSTTDIGQAQAGLRELEKQNEVWKAQLNNLAEAKVALRPGNVPNEPPGDPGPGPGTYTPTPTGPTGFGPGVGQQGGGPLGNLLNSLLGGQQGQQGQQQQPGSCQQMTVCANSSLYSRNTQCVDTKMQECEFGCANDGKTCAPKSDPKKCTNEPKKPSASKCQDGSWKPERNSKECIVDWECVPEDEDAVKPTAQISCQPRIADVGMTVAVTYGCSAGTSEGDGFDTGGARSGSATVTLSDPAAGSNKVFFGVTCTEKNLSDFEACEVQVGKPGIVLVANPQSVEEDATTQIGWTTSGMSSCVVSSPQQSDFTARNENITTVSGTAETDPISSGSIDVLLTCTTLGGQTREASTTVTVANSTGE